jgi:hypothetical protein
MLDVILDLLGATLFVGQAVYFLVRGDSSIPWGSTARSAGTDVDGLSDGFEMGARRL